MKIAETRSADPGLRSNSPIREGPLVAQVTSHPALGDFSVKHFDVLEAVTRITRGPIEKAIPTSEAA